MRIVAANLHIKLPVLIQFCAYYIVIGVLLTIRAAASDQKS